MYFSVKVITNAAKNEIIEKNKCEFLIKVTATAERGRANSKMLELLSKHLKVSKSEIGIVKGKYSSKKLININKHK